jgi:hypothetical protein
MKPDWKQPGFFIRFGTFSLGLKVPNLMVIILNIYKIRI